MDKSINLSDFIDQRHYDLVSNIVDQTKLSAVDITFHLQYYPTANLSGYLSVEIRGHFLVIYKYVWRRIRFEQDARVFEAINKAYVYSAEMESSIADSRRT
ncbi:hypothetical protein RF11_10074 [Thelohanellus kitauei]|uniref:Uncharacterized protein n=1 Tax=Thelohanellus kitauei TaxID=669202 RepID=A0A0C2NLT1_THEKT|nr:hypothetical protein RF11_10074 [Thelohanellus kitauei]